MSDGSRDISIVVPVRDGAATLPRCLAAVRASAGIDAEIIVVDDGSRDESADVAAAQGATVIRLEQGGGPARARNVGARTAAAPLLAFVDADVVVRPDALARLAAALDDPAVVAAFGSYDDRPEAPGLVSSWRNLLHHHTHQTAREEASTFWAGLGLVRREVLLGLGGFDERYQRPSVEDIELGYRLRAGGKRVRLVKEAQGTHLKRWTLASMVRTDVLARGLPWSALLLAGRGPADDLNLRPTQRASVAATGLAAMAALWAVLRPAPMAWSAVVLAVALVVALNLPFHGFLVTRRGLGFALRAAPLHLVYFLCCGLAVVLAACGGGRRA